MLLPPKFSSCSLIRDVEITRVNLVLQVNWVATIDGAAHSVASSKDLLDGTLELLRTALEAHLASNVNDGGLWQIAGVLDVLRLLTITQWLLQGLDDKTRCVWFDVNLGGTILDGEFHSDANALPCGRVLHNIITNLLRGHTQRSNLWGQHGRRCLLSAILAQAHNCDGIGINLGCHVCWMVNLQKLVPKPLEPK